MHNNVQTPCLLLSQHTRSEHKPIELGIQSVSASISLKLLVGGPSPNSSKYIQPCIERKILKRRGICVFGWTSDTLVPSKTEECHERCLQLRVPPQLRFRDESMKNLPCFFNSQGTLGMFNKIECAQQKMSRFLRF